MLLAKPFVPPARFWHGRGQNNRRGGVYHRCLPGNEADAGRKNCTMPSQIALGIQALSVKHTWFRYQSNYVYYCLAASLSPAGKTTRDRRPYEACRWEKQGHGRYSAAHVFDAIQRSTDVGTPASDSATDRLAAHASERDERERARVEESVRDYLLHRHITRRQVTRSKILDSR